MPRINVVYLPHRSSPRRPHHSCPPVQHKTPLSIHMFVFIGRLMGMSLRWKATLNFEFPSLVWKLLLGQRPDEGDLQAMDQLAAQALYAIRHCDNVRDGRGACCSWCRVVIGWG